MASYNTIPDLESEPLVAAPRKLGKTLAVVALFGFAAGAAVATAAPHVAAKMNLVAAGGESDVVVATAQRASTDATPYYIGEDAEEVTAAPAAIETDVTPQVVNHCAPNCAEDAGALGKGKGGETVGYSTEAQIQGNANANGAAPDTTGQI